VIEYDDDKARLDRATIVDFLMNDAYWGRRRSAADIGAQIDGAWRVVGAYEGGRLVGFARALSDGIALAYLADVFVLDAARGRGIGSELVRIMVEDGPGSRFRWMLHTRDAHEVYRKRGFDVPDSTYMERPARPT
jgi:GNAT superfamily N-acetyltransferase